MGITLWCPFASSSDAHALVAVSGRRTGWAVLRVWLQWRCCGRRAYALVAVSGRRTGWAVMRVCLQWRCCGRRAYALVAVSGRRTGWAVLRVCLQWCCCGRRAYALVAVSGRRTGWAVMRVWLQWRRCGRPWRVRRRARCGTGSCTSPSGSAPSSASDTTSRSCDGATLPPTPVAPPRSSSRYSRWRWRRNVHVGRSPCGGRGGVVLGGAYNGLVFSAPIYLF